MMAPYVVMLYLGLIGCVVIVLSSGSLFVSWIGLEVSSMCLIPLILAKSSQSEMKSSQKYFVAQTIGGIIVLWGILSNRSVILTLGLLIKLGVAPFHLWYIGVMSGVSWGMCLLLSTLQKLIPLCMLSQLSPWGGLAFIGGLSSVVGSFMGMNQTQMRSIVGYSSLTHMGWALAGMAVSPSIGMSYFICYCVMSAGLISLLYKGEVMSLTSLLGGGKHFSRSVVACLVCLGGVPPLIGFFGKIVVVSGLLTKGHVLLVSVLLSSSLVSMYYYITVGVCILFKSGTKVVQGEEPFFFVSLLLMPDGYGFLRAILFVLAGIFCSKMYKSGS